MVMILVLLSASLPWSYAGSFMTAHTACSLYVPYTCSLIYLAFSCGHEPFHQIYLARPCFSQCGFEDKCTCDLCIDSRRGLC